MGKNFNSPDLAEQFYELEKSKEIYPKSWEEYEKIQEHMKLVFWGKK